MTSTQLSTIAHVSSVRRDPDATPPPAIDLASICAGGCAAAAAEFARMAEKLRLALPRPERMDAAVAAVLPELASGSAALRRLGEAIAELDQLRKPLQFEPIELGDLSMGMLADWKERAPSHSLELALPGELPTVLASPRYAPLALNILIEAGVSMAPAGSPVRVSIRPQNESVLVSVQYAGAPLCDGDLDRLFEPYYRPEALPQFQVGGGIGLTLARAVLLAHGGRLWAESSLGGEITALLATWPLIPAPPTALPVVAPPSGRLSLATEGPVILVLDTDSRMLRYLRANLDAQRYKPVLAKNVDEMWRLIDLEEPDLADTRHGFDCSGRYRGSTAGAASPASGPHHLSRRRERSSGAGPPTRSGCLRPSGQAPGSGGAAGQHTSGASKPAGSLAAAEAQLAVPDWRALR